MSGSDDNRETVSLANENRDNSKEGINQDSAGTNKYSVILVLCEQCRCCGNLNPEGALFCNKCGARISVSVCPNCGEIPPEGSAFCNKCGASLPGRKASPSNLTSLNPSFGQRPLSEELKKGQYVYFGRYPQNNGNKLEPIEWLVVDNDDDTALLISRYGLDCKPFNNECEETSWKYCSLREWLNSSFLRRAFSRAEEERIAETTVFTREHPLKKWQRYPWSSCLLCSGGSFSYLTSREELFDKVNGEESLDKIFCLSSEEVKIYFYEFDEKIRLHRPRKEFLCEPTDYAIAKGVYKNDDSDCCVYWLRSSGVDDYNAAFVDSFCGQVHDGGAGVACKGIAVRPALRVKAGTLNGRK